MNSANGGSGIDMIKHSYYGWLTIKTKPIVEKVQDKKADGKDAADARPKEQTNSHRPNALLLKTTGLRPAVLPTRPVDAIYRSGVTKRARLFAHCGYKSGQLLNQIAVPIWSILCNVRLMRWSVTRP